RRFALAERDKIAAALPIAAGDGSHDAVAAVENGFPILPRNFGGAEDAPTHFGCFHDLADCALSALSVQLCFRAVCFRKQGDGQGRRAGFQPAVSPISNRRTLAWREPI